MHNNIPATPDNNIPTAPDTPAAPDAPDTELTPPEDTAPTVTWSTLVAEKDKDTLRGLVKIFLGEVVRLPSNRARPLIEECMHGFAQALLALSRRNAWYIRDANVLLDFLEEVLSSEFVRKCGERPRCVALTEREALLYANYWLSVLATADGEDAFKDAWTFFGRLAQLVPQHTETLVRKARDVLTYRAIIKAYSIPYWMPDTFHLLAEAFFRLRMVSDITTTF